MNEFVIRRTQGPDSYIIADGFTTKEEALEYADSLPFAVAEGADNITGELSAAFVHEVYHHDE